MARDVLLTDLGIGNAARIVSVDVNGNRGRRLEALGLVTGTSIRVIRKAPLGDPLEYELRGTRLCLRSQDARHIHVEIE